MPSEDRGALYSSLVCETEIDRALDSRAYDLYCSIVINAGLGAGEPLISLSEANLSREIAGGISYKDYKERFVFSVRIRTLSHLKASREIITQKLNELEKVYFRRLVKYRKLPVITYKALTQPKVRRQRLDVMPYLTPLDRMDQEYILKNLEWQKNVENYLRALEELKELSTKMSKDLVEWQKFVGDIWRLNVAVISIVLAAIGIFGFRIYEYVKGPHNSISSGHCALIYKTGAITCTFVTK